MTYSEWTREELGYETITTYYDDFTIAEHFGASAIKDTYKRALLNNDYRYLTELCMVLNHKIWANYKHNEPIARVYNDLWQQLENKLYAELKGEELEYFIRTTD